MDSNTRIKCPQCGASLSGNEPRCQFCDARLAPSKTGTKSRKRNSNNGTKNTIFFESNVSTRERVMALCSYCLVGIIAPIIYYKKHPDERSRFIIEHMNQGLFVSIISWLCIVLTILKNVVPQYIAVHIELISLSLRMAFAYCLIIIILNIVLIVRGGYKHYPFVRHFAFFKQ